MDPGDDSVVLRVYLQWAKELDEVLKFDMDKPLGYIHRLNTGIWELVFALKRGPDKQQIHHVEVDPDAARANRLPLKKLAPGVWDISLPVYIEEQFHGFVTLLKVPNPASWE